MASSAAHPWAWTCVICGRRITHRAESAHMHTLTTELAVYLVQRRVLDPTEITRQQQFFCCDHVTDQGHGPRLRGGGGLLRQDMPPRRALPASTRRGGDLGQGNMVDTDDDDTGDDDAMAVSSDDYSSGDSFHEHRAALPCLALALAHITDGRGDDLDYQVAEAGE